MPSRTQLGQHARQYRSDATLERPASGGEQNSQQGKRLWCHGMAPCFIGLTRVHLLQQCIHGDHCRQGRAQGKDRHLRGMHAALREQAWQGSRQPVAGATASHALAHRDTILGRRGLTDSKVHDQADDQEPAQVGTEGPCRVINRNAGRFLTTASYYTTPSRPQKLSIVGFRNIGRRGLTWVVPGGGRKPCCTGCMAPHGCAPREEGVDEVAVAEDRAVDGEGEGVEVTCGSTGQHQAGISGTGWDVIVGCTFSGVGW